MRASLLLFLAHAGTPCMGERVCSGAGVRVPCGRSGNGIQPSGEAFNPQQCSARGCCADVEIEECFMPWAGASPNITTVHLIHSNHFDAGYTDHLVGVINTYFTEFFPRAVSLGKQLREAGGEEGLAWMTQSYLVSLYLQCPPNAGLTCPSDDEVAAFTEAAHAGDITWHAFPHNAEMVMTDSSLLRFGIAMTHDLDESLGLPRKTVVSQRDVPGFERSVIPVLKSAGVTMLSEGMNGRIYPVNVPPAFVWRDGNPAASVTDDISPHGSPYGPVKPPSNEDILAIWHPKGYGGLGDYVTVPGFSHALAYDWRGDNQGPPQSIEEVQKGFDKVRADFPGATVIASTLDAYAVELAKVKDSLPVVTGEIGDSWIWGVGSDPEKVARMRAINRQRSSCIQSGRCPAIDAPDSDPALWNMSRLLIKGSEHTWGISVNNFGDHKKKGWSNEKFHNDRLSGEHFVTNFEQEWRSQMAFAVDYPLEALEVTPSPAALYLKQKIEQEFVELTPRKIDPSSEGFTEVAASSVLSRIGGWCDFGVDPASGAVTTLIDHGTDGKSLGTTWASESNPLALQRYQTLTEKDYAAWRAEYLIQDCDSEYGKPGQDAEEGWSSEHQLLPPTVQSLWVRNDSQPEVLMSLVFPDHLHSLYGAPSAAWVRFSFDSSSTADRAVHLAVTYINKTATRLGEAMFVTMNPPGDTNTTRSWWAIDKLGEWVSPLELVDGAPKGLHGHSTGVKFARAGADGSESHVFFESKDTAMVAFDAPTPFPVPIHAQPDLKEGASFLLWNNIWNTNYIFWWPYDTPSEQMSKDIVFRFSVRFLDASTLSRTASDSLLI